jgi:DNA-binding IclR family transcriptional regulator
MGNSENGGDRLEPNRTTVKSVETSVTIIESLKRKDSAGITDLAQATGLSKSNVHKHLATLQQEGFVVKEGDQYRLSLRYLDFGSDVRQQYEGTQFIQPRVSEVAEETGEVAQFMVEERGWSVIVYKEVGRQGVFTRTRPGTHLQMHQVASGKAMLAFMPESRVEAIIDRHGLDAATDNTITSEPELFEELDRTRERGYALNKGESTKGLHAVAAPITKPDDEVIGSCAVSGPSHRMKGRTEVEIPEHLLSIANEIELNIAHS